MQSIAAFAAVGNNDAMARKHGFEVGAALSRFEGTELAECGRAASLYALNVGTERQDAWAERAERATLDRAATNREWAAAKLEECIGG